MKKVITTLSSFLVLSALTVGAALSFNGKMVMATAPELPHEGDLYGGAHISFKASSETDVLATIHLDKNKHFQLLNYAIHSYLHL